MVKCPNCGGTATRIPEAQMPEGRDLVACKSCSWAIDCNIKLTYIRHNIKLYKQLGISYIRGK